MTVRGGLVKVLDGQQGPAGPAVEIGGRWYPSSYAATHKWTQARRATANPFRKLLAAAILLSLKKIEIEADA